MVRTMFLKICTIILSLISVAICKPQLFTFKDGKIGVNFLGFNAEAGLGGLLTGNAAHGGLSASAGTPFGQRAAAGIGGHNGQDGTYGGAFAGATAGEGISARAGLGGIVGGGGMLGAEASAGGSSSSVFKTVGSGTVNEAQAIEGNAEDSVDVNAGEQQQNTVVVQKIKPPKKYVGENIIEDNAETGIALDIDTRFTKTDLAAPSAAVSITSDSTVNNNPAVFQKTITKTVEPVNKQGTQSVTFQKYVRPAAARRRYHVQKQFINPFLFQFQPVASPSSSSVVEVEKRHQLFAPVEYSKVKSTITAVEPAPIEYSKVKTSVYAQKPQTVATQQHTVTAQGQFNGQNFFDNIFNIPISTLKAVNQFLNQGLGQGQVSVRKTVDVQSAH